MKELYIQLQKLVNDCTDDMQKAFAGNRAAGTRVRKAMQEIKLKAQEIRKAALVKPA